MKQAVLKESTVRQIRNMNEEQNRGSCHRIQGFKLVHLTNRSVHTDIDRIHQQKQMIIVTDFIKLEHFFGRGDMH